jgi:hypothetical protein
MENNVPRTTIGIKKSTKSRLDHSRAPGQCYDGFLCQLIGLWEKTHNEDPLSKADSNRNAFINREN